MEKITPCLWFNTSANEAVEKYISLFENAAKLSETFYDEASSKVSGMPAGSLLTAEFTIRGQKFLALNGGTAFSFTPATSFYVECSTVEELDILWTSLSEGGKSLMPLGEYPFSKKYGWLNDKFGVSWQLNLVENSSRIIPSLMFVGKNAGKAGEAINYYLEIFPNSKVNVISTYEEGDGDTVGLIKFGSFSLNGNEFIVMDSSYDHKFTLSQAVSFIINCETQEQVDMYWDALSAGGEIQECGWLKDKFGIAWQVVPSILGKLLGGEDHEKAGRVMQAMLGMKKLIIEDLENA